MSELITLLRSGLLFFHLLGERIHSSAGVAVIILIIKSDTQIDIYQSAVGPFKLSVVK